jgi:hypothetical protein
MANSRNKGETIHSEARDLINRVNHRCKQEAVKKSLILPICRADEKTANYCGGSVATVKQIRRESRDKLCRVKALHFWQGPYVPPMSARTAKVKAFLLSTWQCVRGQHSLFPLQPVIHSSDVKHVTSSRPTLYVNLHDKSCSNADLLPRQFWSTLTKYHV